MLSRLSFPTQMLVGPDAIQQLPGELAPFAPERALMVMDAGLVQAGIIEQIEQLLSETGISWTLFDETEANPAEANVEAGLACYQQIECDFILAIGGGSPLDLGKAIRLRVHHEPPLDLYDDLKDGASRITPDMPGMIAVPTAAGTGSEVGRSAVITLTSTGLKTVIFSPYLNPNVAICDPKLTLSLPPHLTAATGMDALTHNLEAFLATNYHPICDGIALEGIRLASEYLTCAVTSGDDLEARGGMMMAAMMGAIAFQKGLGVAHSLAHPLSTLCGLHHGLANAIMLPHAMRFNLNAAPERLKRVALALGEPVQDLDPPAAARRGIERVERLLVEVGLPVRLRDVDVQREQIPELVAQAIQDGCRLTNPRPCTEETMQALYRAAF